MGHGAILHPRCTVFAAPGAAVVIGAKTIIEELVEIRCNRGTVTIGERCLLQVGSRCVCFLVQMITCTCFNAVEMTRGISEYKIRVWARTAK